ncbi:MAG: hypothetical protein WAK44_26705, partial [Trebonia sp.]|uniref:hypothetical protein n=1 Tax=Trebonia sp. TaxID=2767075 RepID=UPI003BB05F8A
PGPDKIDRDFYVRQLRDWKFSFPIEADRDRGGDHPGRSGRHRMAGAEPVLQGCPQENAAGPERAANHEILTSRRAIRARFAHR